MPAQSPAADSLLGEHDLLSRDELAGLVRRSYFFAHGKDPGPDEIDFIVAAEMAAAKKRMSNEGGEAPPPRDISTTETKLAGGDGPRESRFTWLNDDELREAERAVLWARLHGIPCLSDAVADFCRNRRVASAPLLPRCLAEFVVAKRCEGLNENTLAAYGGHVGQFVRDFADRRPSTVAPKEIADYLLRWTNPYTRAMKWQILATFFAWTMRQQYVANNPVFLAMRKPRTPPPERRILAPTAARALLQAASKTETIGYWCLGLFAGLRTGEIRALQQIPDPWSVVLFDSGVIDLREEITKTWPRVIPIRPVLRQWLHWLKARQLPFWPKNFYEKCQPLRRVIVETLGPPPPDRPPGTRDWTLENIGRRSYISCRLALAGGSFAEVTVDVGNTEEVIRKHYLSRVTRSQAEAYFALSPTRVGAA